MTNLIWPSVSREEVAIVVAMQRDEEHTGVIVEHFLGTVAMVNILDIGGERDSRSIHSLWKTLSGVLWCYQFI